MNRTYLMNNHENIYRFLLKNNRSLLDRNFPKSLYYSTIEEAYEACCKLGITKKLEYRSNYKKDPKLPSMPHQVYQNWSYKNINRINRSFSKLLSLMPKNVKWKENQEWKGTKYKYAFIDEDYGEFTSYPSFLMSKVWPHDRTGHPVRSKVIGEKHKKTTMSRYFYCIETKEVFSNKIDASKKLNISMTLIIRNLNHNRNRKNKSTKGLTFRYLTPEEFADYQSKIEEKKAA